MRCSRWDGAQAEANVLQSRSRLQYGMNAGPDFPDFSAVEAIKAKLVDHSTTVLTVACLAKCGSA